MKPSDYPYKSPLLSILGMPMGQSANNIVYSFKAIFHKRMWVPPYIDKGERYHADFDKEFKELEFNAHSSNKEDRGKYFNKFGYTLLRPVMQNNVTALVFQYAHTALEHDHNVRAFPIELLGYISHMRNMGHIRSIYFVGADLKFYDITDFANCVECTDWTPPFGPAIRVCSVARHGEVLDSYAAFVDSLEARYYRMVDPTNPDEKLARFCQYHTKKNNITCRAQLFLHQQPRTPDPKIEDDVVSFLGLTRSKYAEELLLSVTEDDYDLLLASPYTNYAHT